MSDVPKEECPEIDRPQEAQIPDFERDLRALQDEAHITTTPLVSIEEQSVIELPPLSFLESYTRQPVPPPIRFPNLLDVFLLTLLLLFCWACSGALFALAIHFHLGGISSAKQAISDIRFALGSQVAWYCLALSGCLLLFPAIWQKGFFEGLEWHAAAAIQKRWRLCGATLTCFALALVDGLLLPGPQDTPIDQVFRMPGAAWLLFAFGVTMAPLFEEMGFRGFLLPAFCTAVDWVVERVTHRSPPEPDSEGMTRWSGGALVAGSVLTSIPFALMHAYQTGWALGPFLLLICVSMVLCWIRLSTRSLAASTLVHSSYNLLLFSLMLAGTDGFKHLDKM